MTGAPETGHPQGLRHARSPVVFLLLLTFAALFVHGYHPRAEDSEMYVSGIVQTLHPSYYPIGRQFFQAQTNLTLFTRLVAWSVRLSHLPLDWVLFIGQLASIFLLLLGCWKIACKCFPSPSGRWGAVGLVAALLTLPIASTALYILDQYLDPRSLAAFAFVFAIVAVLDKKYTRAGLWLVFTALVEPLMAVFAVSYAVLLYLFQRRRPAWLPLLPAWIIPTVLVLHPSRAYLLVLSKRPDLLLFDWPWYGWLGAVAPLALLWWIGRIGRSKQRPVLQQTAESMALFGLIFLAGAIFVSIPQDLVSLIRFQPMRSLYLVYLFLILLGGGLLGEIVLKAKPARWLLLFVPLCAGMCYAQFQLFPQDRHVEWPGARAENPWVQAFQWIRGHTPPDAIFAINPDYMNVPGEDDQGFRANAERSRLADDDDDWSVAGLFPGLPLARVCLSQLQAEKGWTHFTPADFERLKRSYDVTWVVVRRGKASTMTCPYQNSEVSVCRIK